MAAIDEDIVREYFEQNGFFVRQVRKYQVQSRKKTDDEQIDFLVFNPAWRKNLGKPDFFLFGTELPKVHHAVVAVKPWHTDRFTPTMLKSNPDIFRFVQEDVIKDVERYFPVDPGEPGAGKDLLKILVLPGLPTADPFKTESVRLLQEKGIDAILSFRSILIDLIEKVEINKSYRKSDTLQVLRILKNYDLFKDTQLDLFKR
jgi:hypothetical protein